MQHSILWPAVALGNGPLTGCPSRQFSALRSLELLQVLGSFPGGFSRASLAHQALAITSTWSDQSFHGVPFDDLHADPLPELNTRSIGHPQLTSTKSTLPAHSFAMTSAVGTRVLGLFPATWIPNILSHGCLLTRDHSSFDPERKDVARPTRKSEK